MPLTDDPAYLTALLQRTVPGIGPIVGLERVADGYGAITLRSATGLGIRIPHSRRLAELQYRTAPALRRLAPLLPAPIPVPLWMLPAGYPFETGAIGYRWIDGEQPDPDTASTSLVEQIGAFLATLHGIDGETLDAFDGRVPGPADVAAERERVMGIALPWLRDRLPNATMVRLERWWNGARTARSRAWYEPRLIHGDFWHGNLLVDDSGDRLAGVIDWEHVALDDPAQDLATLLHGGQAFSDAVLQAYAAAGGTVDDATLARRDAHWAYPRVHRHRAGARGRRRGGSRRRNGQARPRRPRAALHGARRMSGEALVARRTTVDGIALAWLERPAPLGAPQVAFLHGLGASSLDFTWLTAHPAPRPRSAPAHRRARVREDRPPGGLVLRN